MYSLVCGALAGFGLVIGAFVGLIVVVFAVSK